MLNHFIQKKIVHKLAFVEGLRFSELKPDDLDNKLFDYHLKILIRDGYVDKSDEGVYSLTDEGKIIGFNAFEQDQKSFKNAYPVLILGIKHPENGWLLGKRKVHPLFGKVGFAIAKPSYELDSVQAAKQQVEEKTGLVIEPKVLGSGFLRGFVSGELDTFTQFTYLAADYVSGELQQNDQNTDYYWEDILDFSNPDYLLSVKVLIELHEKGEPFFIEKTFKV